MALCTGYRRLELKSLQVKNLDIKGYTLPLGAQYTKSRKDARQPLPRLLMDQRVFTPKSGPPGM